MATQQMMLYGNSGQTSPAFKFHPGHYLTTFMGEQTTGIGSIGTFGSIVDDIGGTLAHFNNNVKGYRHVLDWRDAEDFTQTTNQALTAGGLTGTALQTAINTQYPGFTTYIATAFYTLQAYCPGLRLATYINFYVVGPNNYTNAVITGNNWVAPGGAAKCVPPYIANGGVVDSGSVGHLKIPDFYGSTSTAKYSGTIAQIYGGSSYYGFAFAAFNGSNAFSQIIPHFWNPPICQAMVQCVQALALWQLPSGAAYNAGTAYVPGNVVTSSGTSYICIANTTGNAPPNASFWVVNAYAGQTLDACQLFEMIGTNDEYSLPCAGGSSNNITGSSYQNPPDSTGTSFQASTTNANAGLSQLFTGWCAAFPHTVVDTCLSFGMGSGIPSFPSYPQLGELWNNEIPSGAPLSGGLAGIRGLALGCSNFFGNNFLAGQATATGMSQAHIGIDVPATIPGSGSTVTLPAPNPAHSLVGVCPASIQHQAEDYWQGIAVGTTAYSATVTYSQFSIVTSSGTSYIYTNSTPAMGTSVTDTTHWQPILVSSAANGENSFGVIWSLMLPGRTLGGNWYWWNTSTSSVLSSYQDSTAFFKNVVYPVLQVAPAPSSTVPSTIGSPRAPVIGINLAAGDSSTFSFEGFPIFQDRFRESRPGSGSQALDANGWPSSDFTVVPYEGSVAFSWLTVNTNYFSCGFTSKNGGLETITGSGCTISNVVHGTLTTFRATVQTGHTTFTFSVSGTAGGVTNIFCYLPEYNSNTTYSASSLFTTEFVALYSQFPYVRLMFAQNSWYNAGVKLAFTGSVSGTTATLSGTYTSGTYPAVFNQSGLTPDARNVTISGTSVTWTGALSTAASSIFVPCTSTSRHTNVNVKWQQNWQATGLNTEGYPAEWFVDAANACGNSPWIMVPVNADTTYITSLLTMINSNYTGSKPIYLEIGNENWNSGGNAAAYVTINALATLNGYANSRTYYAFLTHQLSGIAQTVFGATKFDNQVKIVTAWQQSQLADLMPAFFSYYTSQGWTPNADFDYLAGAPYINLPSGFSASSTIAQIQSSLTTQSTGGNRAGNSLGAENPEQGAILAMFWGLGYASYEGGWQTNTESATNCGASIMDPGMVAVMQTYYNTIGNSGYNIFTQFESGTSATNNNPNLEPVDELSTQYPITVANSPRFAAIASLATGWSTPTRNVVSGSGSVVSGGNYSETYGGTLATFNFNNSNQPFWAPHFGGIGWVAFLINCTKAGTYSVSIQTTGTGGTTNLEYASNQAANVVAVTGKSIASGTQSTVLASIPLVAGPNYIGLGNGTNQGTAVSLTSITFT